MEHLFSRMAFVGDAWYAGDIPDIDGGLDWLRFFLAVVVLGFGVIGIGLIAFMGMVVSYLFSGMEME